MVIFPLAGGLQAQNSGELVFSLSPGVLLPLGESSDHYATGAFIDGTAAYSLPFAPELFMEGRIGYELAPNSITETNLSLLSLAGGLSLRFALLPKLMMKIHAASGYAMGFYREDTGGSLFVSTGGGIDYDLTSSMSLGLAAVYRYTASSPQPLYQGLGVSLGAGFNLSALSGRSRIEFQDIRLSPVFPVFYKYYDDHPLGSVTFRNGENGRIEDVAVRLFVKQYMDEPKLCLELGSLKKGESVEAPLYALFTDDVLTITEGDKATASVTVTYTYLDRESMAENTVTLRLHHRNAMTWDDDRKAASFVTAKDPVVLAFAKQAAGDVRAEGARTLSRNFRTALGLFQSLGEYGLSYVVDPQTPYKEQSKNPLALDYLQFPGQTLAYRAGDCDDLAILYSALLEAVGIETGFITVPGHIYMAFALEMDAQEARRSFRRPEDLLFREGNVWVPVEVTLLKEGFLAAWQEGAREWRAAVEQGNAGFYPLHQAWEDYEPVGGSDVSGGIDYPGSARVLAAYRAELDRFVRREIAGRVEALEQAISEQNNNPRLINRLGLLFARYGLFAEARSRFEQVAAAYLPALINLGNLLFLEGELQQSLEIFLDAEKRSPDQATILLGIARVSFELENYGAAKQAYSRLERLDPDLANRFAYLASRERETARAGADSYKETVVWEEE